MSQTFLTQSKEETQRIAADFAKTLRGGEVIALVGDVGAGKTTFTQGLVAALGSTSRVKSPTFAVLHEYPVVQHATITRVVHIDFYRFTSPEEVRALELDEYRNGSTVIIAEWPNIFEQDVLQATITLHFSHLHADEREIVIYGD
jgi:tRNA threonylcarbamoyladenosine biosynthesis protein TsaE